MHHWRQKHCQSTANNVTSHLIWLTVKVTSLLANVNHKQPWKCSHGRLFFLDFWLICLDLSRIWQQKIAYQKQAMVGKHFDRCLSCFWRHRGLWTVTSTSIWQMSIIGKMTSHSVLKNDSVLKISACKKKSVGFFVDFSWFSMDTTKLSCAKHGR